jgi:hypothetical protein
MMLRERLTLHSTFWHNIYGGKEKAAFFLRQLKAKNYHYAKA